MRKNSHPPEHTRPHISLHYARKHALASSAWTTKHVLTCERHPYTSAHPGGGPYLKSGLPAVLCKNPLGQQQSLVIMAMIMSANISWAFPVGHFRTALSKNKLIYNNGPFFFVSLVQMLNHLFNFLASKWKAKLFKRNAVCECVCVIL